MRIFAAPDRLVRDPETRLPLPPEGKDVSDYDLHWARLLRDGDVVESRPAAPRSSSKADPA